jgi:hypothetical protein
MNVTTISSATYFSQATSAQDAAPATKTSEATQKATTNAKLPEDKVELSAAAQARLLEKAGESVSQIASNLATTAKTVDEYLGITSSSTAVVEAAALASVARPPASGSSGHTTQQSKG